MEDQQEDQQEEPEARNTTANTTASPGVIRQPTSFDPLCIPLFGDSRDLFPFVGHFAVPSRLVTHNQFLPLRTPALAGVKRANTTAVYQGKTWRTSGGIAVRGQVVAVVVGLDCMTELAWIPTGRVGPGTERRRGERRRGHH
jgi:hypothetical protein